MAWTGITCTVTTARDTYALTIPAPGEHMAYSASMAVAVGEELGLTPGGDRPGRGVL